MHINFSKTLLNIFDENVFTIYFFCDTIYQGCEKSTHQANQVLTKPDSPFTQMSANNCVNFSECI